MKTSNLLLTLLTLALFTGCTASGAFIAANQTNVNLEEDNFTISASNVSGEAESGYVLGLSYSYGVMSNTFAIARVSGTGNLYGEALQNLWANFEADHGSVEGKKLALTNVRYDADMLNLIIYTKVKVTVRADVVEFE